MSHLPHHCDRTLSPISPAQNNATAVFAGLSKVPGLSPVMPQGAMYIMVSHCTSPGVSLSHAQKRSYSSWPMSLAQVGIDLAQFRDFTDDRDFTQKLICEQSVFCLPASVFEQPNYFRIVTTVPEEKIAVAVALIAEFCATHHI